MINNMIIEKKLKEFIDNNVILWVKTYEQFIIHYDNDSPEGVEGDNEPIYFQAIDINEENDQEYDCFESDLYCDLCKKSIAVIKRKLTKKNILFLVKMHIFAQHPKEHLHKEFLPND